MTSARDGRSSRRRVHRVGPATRWSPSADDEPSNASSRLRRVSSVRSASSSAATPFSRVAPSSSSSDSRRRTSSLSARSGSGARESDHISGTVSSVSQPR